MTDDHSAADDLSNPQALVQSLIVRYHTSAIGLVLEIAIVCLM
jgi:hypothetical protein